MPPPPQGAGGIMFWGCPLVHSQALLPLFKIRSCNKLWKFLEFHKISWNFTRCSPFQSSISIVYDATNSWFFLILEMCFFYPWKSQKFLNFGRSGSTAPRPHVIESCSMIATLLGWQLPWQQLEFCFLIGYNIKSCHPSRVAIIASLYEMEPRFQCLFVCFFLWGGCGGFFIKKKKEQLKGCWGYYVFELSISAPQIVIFFFFFFGGGGGGWEFFIKKVKEQLNHFY